jgi:serine/threonine protein kinase
MLFIQLGRVWTPLYVSTEVYIKKERRTIIRIIHVQKRGSNIFLERESISLLFGIVKAQLSFSLHSSNIYHNDIKRCITVRKIMNPI